MRAGTSLAVSLLVGACGQPSLETGSIEFKDARIKFEINATDGDGGVQIFLDADTWAELEIYDPNGERIFSTSTDGSIALQGGTELFLESAEPTFAELPLPDLLERFPAGDYRFEGTSPEGELITGTATLSHDIPAGPVLLDPADGAEIADLDHTVLSWEPVPPPNGTPIIAYQVLVVEPDTGNPALPAIVLDVMMPADATSVAIPAGFLQSGTEYEWEVLAIEASGNQTLSSAVFTTT
ncbi:MAG TPA: hypothetical protein VJ815_07445 [Acidimicrobiia bacterium]|nr:hypothetical protein [Acidimicrobiia bacterium]